VSQSKGSGEPESRGSLLVVRGTGDLDRPGVRDIGQQCAEADDLGHLVIDRDLQQLVTKRPPTEVRLDPVYQNHVVR